MSNSERRDHDAADSGDLKDDDDDDVVSPLEGLMNPEEGKNSPAADADAPPPG
jgi:hypothetical protein